MSDIEIDLPIPDNCIGSLLIAAGLINSQDLERALEFQRQFGSRLGSILVRIGALSEDALLPVLADQLKLAVLGPNEMPAYGTAITTAIETSGFTTDWFIDQGVVIWEDADHTLNCVSKNPIDNFIREILSVTFPNHTLNWYFARTQDIERILKLIQQGTHTEYQDEIAYLRELAEEAPVIERVNNLLSQAIDENASDIHIEPEEKLFLARYRVDGVLQTRATLPREGFDAVASRIKLIAGMDIAERRLPQDGRISMRASGIEMDIRVSAVPGVHGESIVMRLLPKERADLRLERLGMERDHLRQFIHWIKEPHGIILVTGPTGSGKSTTLYAALQATNDHTKKIITVEDPVEYKMSGITQIQTHSDIGYDFARALRAILRQDPDVIMIGEIRDLETAEIAVQAALTGHMVLSTLHTNDAPSAFTRLLDMGVESFLVASSVRAVQAQRLVRKLCACARPAKPNLTLVADDLRQRFSYLFETDPLWAEPIGCDQCHGTGYRGRIGIYEFLEITPLIQNAIMQKSSQNVLIEIARKEGYRTLREDGLIKAWRGLTSVEEVLRVTGVGDDEV